jgi:glycosyltransferase involved in cell wall biosynthesis
MAEKGIKKEVLFLTEKMTYASATHIWPNSKSLMDFILEKKLVGKQKVSIIGHGSSNGIDLKRFSREELNPHKRGYIKNSVADKPGLKILCVGRMVQDKGIEELVNAFTVLQRVHDLQLLLVGPFEEALDPLPAYIIEIINKNPDIIHISWSDEVEYFMDVADILVHPSHREGFPNAILQAGAMHLPVICSNIPGNIDLVRNEETGLLFESRNQHDLVEKLEYAFGNMHLMEKYAFTLFQEVTELYDRKVVHESILTAYNQLLTAYANE